MRGVMYDGMKGQCIRKRIKKGVGALLAASLAVGALAALPMAANAVDSTQTPSKFDLREKGVVTPVKIQNPGRPAGPLVVPLLQRAVSCLRWA